MNKKNVNFFLANLFFIAAVILYILVLWQGRWGQEFFIVVLVTLAIFLFTLWHAFFNFGPRNALIFLAIALIISFGSEFIGVNIANNFTGYYRYSDLLGPKIFGIPFLVIFMWIAIIYIAYHVSEHITNFRFTERTSFLNRFWVSFWCAILTSLALVAWDFALEPLAVAMGWWEWLLPGEYFGIPMSNFTGWIIISFLIVFLYKLFFEKEKLTEDGAFEYAPLIGYALLGFLTMLMALNLDQPIFALIVFVGMFPFISIMMVRFLVSRFDFPEQYKK